MIPPFRSNNFFCFLVFTSSLCLLRSEKAVNGALAGEIERRVGESSFKRRSLEASFDPIEQKVEDSEFAENESPRRATGGTVHSLLVGLTLLSFLGNGLFLVYVFFFSRVGHHPP
jgi:hypothetical protein